MKNYLQNLLKKYNEEYKNHENIRNNFFEIHQKNLSNIKKINNENIFFLNIYLYNVNNKTNSDILKYFNEELENEITLYILLNSNNEDKNEDFIRNINIGIKDHVFENYVVFLNFVNFKKIPENILENKELIYNNFFIIKI